MGILVGGVLVLGKVLATPTWEFQGRNTAAWEHDLMSGDVTLSNRSRTVLDTEIIPKLSFVALQDTNDSAFKLSLVNALNGLPGVRIHSLNYKARRAQALKELGKFGPAAHSANPVLLQILASHDDEPLRGSAAEALGQIHSDPNVTVPALTACLENTIFDDQAAEALGHFGSLAQSAIPKMLPRLVLGGKEAKQAVLVALPKIDPESAAKAGITKENFTLLQMDPAARMKAVKAWGAETPK